MPTFSPPSTYERTALLVDCGIRSPHGGDVVGVATGEGAAVACAGEGEGVVEASAAEVVARADVGVALAAVLNVGGRTAVGSTVEDVHEAISNATTTAASQAALPMAED
jgi:hypothetical protein